MHLQRVGTGAPMEPIPETVELIGEFGQFYDVDLLHDLDGRAEAVKALVPELVGLSIGSVEDGVAFTLVATDTDVAVLDAVQYLAGGPCAEVPSAEEVLEYDSGEPDDERRWQTFAQATGAKAVSSTLTLPILDGEKVVGSVNLYAASGGAFAGLHQEIADIFDAWAPGAVTNADLSFRTRRTAEESPGLLRAAMRVETAVGMLMAAESVDAVTARRRLQDAAQRAGVAVEDLAASLLEAFQRSDERH